jgi:hypothetical protein
VPIDNISNLQALKNNEALFFQVRWNDPDSLIQNYVPSGRSGDAYIFGQKPFDSFMNSIGASVMIRSHEYPQEGYKLSFNDRLVTIFSNGGDSWESYYQGRVKPKYVIASLSEQITKIDPQKHIVAIK